MNMLTHANTPAEEKVTWAVKARRWFRSVGGKVERVVLVPQARGPQDLVRAGARPSRRRHGFLSAFAKVSRMQYAGGLPVRRVRRDMARLRAKQAVRRAA